MHRCAAILPHRLGRHQCPTIRIEAAALLRCRPWPLPTGLPLCEELEPGSHRSSAMRNSSQHVFPLHSRGLSSLEALLSASSQPRQTRHARSLNIRGFRVHACRGANKPRNGAKSRVRKRAAANNERPPREKHEDYELTRSAAERARPAGRAPSRRKRVAGPTRSRAPPRTSSPTEPKAAA